MARGFGLSYRGRGRGGRGRGRGRGAGPSSDATPIREEDGTQLAEKFERVKISDEVDEKMGFSRIEGGPRREGWLINMQPTLVRDAEWPGGRAAVDFYFIEDDGGMFKCTYLYEPYFYIACKTGTEQTIEEWLAKKYESLIVRVVRHKKEDLKLPNHLMGHRSLYIQLCFRNISDLLAVRRDLLPLALANAAKRDAVDAYADVVRATAARMDVDYEDNDDEIGRSTKHSSNDTDPRECIIDIREYDVPYYLRVAIDNHIRVGLWYAITFTESQPALVPLEERVKRADPVVLAYDIETTKAPLKFPDRDVDVVMMISYMVDGQGYLIVNRDVVSEDVGDFEYTPKEGYEGPFVVFNEGDEAATIKRFFTHIQDLKPTVLATFNGDFFDFPFLDARASVHGIDMYLETGFSKDSEDEYKSRTCAHMDCFRWVKRDSYLPQGSQGLKAVTSNKLGYNPIELDPELMTPYAQSHPRLLAQYSVSDAVATYYLYMKYVHPFIFSLCNIIPLCPDEVLRKGTGTLCETLLMVEAYKGHIIMPNRHEEAHGNVYEGHLLASETYVGGHVEALEAGVFRSDIETEFRIVPGAVQQLIDDLDAALKFYITQEMKTPLESVMNYEDVKSQITQALTALRDTPNSRLTDKPLIYHLDVAAMYPNIMLSNRLQPDSVVGEEVCAVCDFNRPGKGCDRRLEWAWRGEYFPAMRDEVNMIRHALNQETFPPKKSGGVQRRFAELGEVERTALLHKRLGDYSRKVYKRTKETRVETREAIVCQRENPFYVDTVRRFRDRRYEYKGLLKMWKRNLDVWVGEGRHVGEVDEARKMVVLYDSLQLAHKCILNSFYGYVMRKGARWHSMEMAGITCLTGATIIQMARALVEQIGRPLELDTDGIWCMLPGAFPENFVFELEGGKRMGVSYPCTMLNHLVYDGFTNHQYHELDVERGVYEVHSENSIFFELDGPYRAMILPSSKEEDKLLKKRYAVFNDDGSLAELKGFEVKRRGELQLIKIFQSQIFERFLLGRTTEECYAAVAGVADRWLDVLFSKGASLSDEEMVELIAENRSMSKTLKEYGAQKSTSISTARRLAEFLGEGMVKDKGLACKFIISAKPMGAPVTERAVPVAIFSAEESVKRMYLRRWLKDSALVTFGLREVLDWGYYVERLGSVIQKLITIPAAMQGVANPVPRVRHPEWLYRRVAGKEDRFKQNKVTDFFGKRGEGEVLDIEESVGRAVDPGRKRIVPRQRTYVREPTPDTTFGEGDVPDAGNYPAWITGIRRKWRRKVQERFGGAGSGVTPSMFKSTRVRAVQQRWDIIQLRETMIPGRFILWLLIDGEVVDVPLRIPREFYVHLKRPVGDLFQTEFYSAQKVVRNLPRNAPCTNLYKVVVKEDVYQDIQEHFIDITNDTGVDGVYELQVPLVVRGLLRLGKTCTLEDTTMTLNRARQIGLDLTQLDRGVVPPREQYLQGGKAGKYAFLYHGASSNNSLHVFALFTPTGIAKLFLVDPATRRQAIPRLSELYSTLLQKKQEVYGNSASVSYPNTIEFSHTYHSTDVTALKAVSRELGLMEDRSLIVVISSARDVSYFERNAPKLAKFPILSMSSSKGPHSLDVFPWQSHVGQKIISRYLSLGNWVDRMVAFANYYDVPVGHVEGDHPLVLADISFARRLVQQDMVLWWSPSNLPDLGGIENDRRHTEPLPKTDFQSSGIFTNVCLEIKVRNLAVNSVLQSVLVNELEGSGGTTAFDSVSHTMDEYSNGEAHRDLTFGESQTSSQMFSIMRAMVKGWYLDKIRDNSTSPAGLAIDHFWRWVSSSASQLYDPSIHRFVHGLMRKVFVQMLAEFKRLGSHVVHADFGSILLSTSKPPGTAHAYATYLATAVTSHELFQHIYLNTERFYDFLVFMDVENMGGIVCEDPLAIEPPAELSLEMRWDIQKSLPPAIQEDFAIIVQYFIVELYAIYQKVNAVARVPLRPLENGELDSTQRDEAKASEVEGVYEFISRKLTRKMLRALEGVMKRFHEASMKKGKEQEQEHEFERFQFPIRPGLFLNLVNPPLEFVKFACAVFGLAREYGVEVGLMKRSLLELVGVREFAVEATFRNPCDPLKLVNVPCNHCDVLRDLDFCRDPDLTAATRDSKWHCNHCGGEYDRQAIEFALIDMLHQLERSFVQQDLRCGKCHQIQADNVSRWCKCSGAYQLTVNRAEVKRKMRTMYNVAVRYNLHRLKECVRSIQPGWLDMAS